MVLTDDIPNIVLLTIDCLRADRLGCYGYNRTTTPTLDRIADDGFRWERCYSTGPRTNESFPGIMAGALSSECGYYGETWHRTPPKPTLASWLSDRGYYTAARIANPQLVRQKGYSHGFDSFENLAAGEVGWGVDGDETTNDTQMWGKVLSNIGSKIHDVRANIRKSGSFQRWGIYAPLFVAYREYQRHNRWPTVAGAEIGTELIRVIQDTETASTPAFYWSHFNDSHAPIHPSRVAAGGLCEAGRIRQYVADIKRISREESKQYGAMYDSTVRYVDNQIDRIIRGLKSSGQWENTVLVITADHGEALYDRGVYGHASGQDRYTYDPSRDYMFDELLRVPLIVGGGAVSGSGRIDEPMSTAWLHELIAEVAGVSAGAFVRASTRDSHLDPTDSDIVLADTLTERGHTFAAIRDETKVVTQAVQPDSTVAEGAHVFDLAVDPNERSPRKPDEREAEVLELIRDNVRSIEQLEEVSARAEVGAETKDLLAQLGYTE